MIYESCYWLLSLGSLVTGSFLLVQLLSLKKADVKLDTTEYMSFWSLAAASLLQSFLGIFVLSNYVSCKGFVISTICTEVATFCLLALLCVGQIYARNILLDPIFNFIIFLFPWFSGAFWAIFPFFGYGKYGKLNKVFFCVLNWGSENKIDRIYFNGLILFGFAIPISLVVWSHIKNRKVQRAYQKVVQLETENIIQENKTKSGDICKETVFSLGTIHRISSVRVCITHPYFVSALAGKISKPLPNYFQDLSTVLMLLSYVVLPGLLGLEIIKLKRLARKKIF